MTDNLTPSAGIPGGDDTSIETSLRDDMRAEFDRLTGGDDASAGAGANDSGTTDGSGAAAATAGEGAAAAGVAGRARDGSGRFARADQQPPTEGAAATAAPAAAPNGDQADTPPADDQAPGSFRAEARAKWAETPPEVKAEILRREADASRMATNIDGERRFAREMADIIRPYDQEIRSAGVSPQFAVQVLMQNHRTMQSGPIHEKVALARRMIHEYGLDPRQLIDPNAPTDPHLLAMQRQIEQIQVQQTVPKSFDHAPLPQPEQNANIASDVDAFRADPAHPHFDQVAPVMVTLLEAGHATDLTDAYVKATRSMGLEQQQVAAPAPTPPTPAPQPLATASQKVAAARHASASVAASPGPSGAPVPGTMREELREQLRKSGLYGG